MAALNDRKPKVLLVANTSWYLYNFRRTLAKAIAAAGYEPVFVAPAEEHGAILESEGFRFRSFKLDRSGINPLNEITTLLSLYRIYCEEKPEYVHHFTIKCILHGTLAAFFARVPATINAITGIGHFLTGDTLRAQIMRRPITLVYRLLMRLPGVKLIFQNRDDWSVFSALKIALDSSSSLIRSSGVDLKHFSPPEGVRSGPPVIVFAGRLLTEKGIREFYEACLILHKRGLNASFKVVGGQDPGNPSSISDAELREWKLNSFISFLGHQSNMATILADADIVVLPSYREGVPKILLEAAAMEIAIVATDVPGCREIVEHNLNGKLVPAKDSQALAKAIEDLALDRSLRLRMGKAGRIKVVREFDADAVACQTLEVYRSFPFFSIQS